MIATYLVDTNMFSYIASGVSPKARAEFRRLADDRDAEVAISAISEAEVRYGLPQRCSAIESLLTRFEILPWDSRAAAAYGHARAALRSEGITVEAMDLLIAAHAASTGAVLVTHDSIFSRIAEIVGIPATVDWATDL